jgi:hypothetical protein
MQAHNQTIPACQHKIPGLSLSSVLTRLQYAYRSLFAFLRIRLQIVRTTALLTGVFMWQEVPTGTQIISVTVIKEDGMDRRQE